MPISEGSGRILKRKFAQLFSNRRGNMALITAIIAVPMMSALGMAIDYSLMSQNKAALQAAADTAALATAKELSLANSDDKTLSNVAQEYALSNLSVIDDKSTMTVETVIGTKRRSVTVNLAHFWKPFMLHYVDKKVYPIRVNSTATLAGIGTVCMIALGTQDKKAIKLKKKAQMSALNCGVYSNSNDLESIQIEDNATMTTGLTCTVGGVRSNKGGSIIPQAVTNCPAIKDPLASRTPPPVGPCLHNKLKLDGGTHTLEPGTYCGGLKVKKDAKVTLNPGVYVISGGKLEVTDNATFEGENVGLYFSDSKSKLTFKKQTTISLTAPKIGPMAGLLMFETRSNKNKLEKHEITSDNARMLLGTIYLPNGSLKIDAEGPVADQAAYTAIIADSIELDEGPTLHLNSDYEATDVPVPEGLAGGKIRLAN